MEKLSLAAAVLGMGFAIAPLFAYTPNADYTHGVLVPAIPGGLNNTGTQTPQNSPQNTQQQASSVLLEKQSFVTHALLIGINDYDEKIGELGGCVNDVNLLKECFARTHQLKEENITILTDHDATKEKIIAALEQVKNKDCDRLLVFFAGHGIGANNQSFLCPINTTTTNFKQEELDNNFQNAVIQKNLIPMKDFLDHLKIAKANEILLILDACRNVVSPEDEKSEELMKSSDQKYNTQTDMNNFMGEFKTLMTSKNLDRKQDKGFAVITACSFGQTSEETDDEIHNGKFTSHFEKGLRGYADTAGCFDGEITLTEAYNYAYSRLSNSGQTPEIFLSSTNKNFVLARFQKVLRVPRPETKQTKGNKYTYTVLHHQEEDLKEQGDLQFLRRTGEILSNVKYWSVNTNKVGLKALDCFLEYVPNDATALAIRGSVHRKLGNYEQALLDYGHTEMKFQLYAQKDTTLTNGNPSDNKGIKRNDLLTVTGIGKDGRLQVSEVNNEPLEKVLWINKSNVHYDLWAAGDTTIATRNQEARHANGTSARQIMEQTWHTSPRGAGPGPITFLP